MKRIIVILLSLLLLACVPTPEQEFVTHKDTEELLNKADVATVDVADGNGQAQTNISIREQYAIPNTLNETFTEAEGHFTVNVDANVEVPDLYAIPIVRVEHGTFNQEQVTKMFEALTNGRELYYRSGQMTKSQIADLIARMEEERSDPALRAELDETDVEIIEEEIASLKEAWKTAPEELSEERCDGTIAVRQFEDNGKTYLRYGMDAETHDRKPLMHFQLDIPGQEEIDSHRLEDTLLNFYDWRSELIGGEGDVDKQYVTIPIRNIQDPTELSAYSFITYTSTQACADLEAFFTSVGSPEIKCDSVTCYVDTKTEKYGYRVNCVREIAGVKTPRAGFSSGGLLVDGQDFKPQWFYENISACIDAQGIYQLAWYAPVKVTETVMDATKLMPFDEIMDRFRKQIWIEKEPWIVLDESIVRDDEFISDMQIELSRITLSLQRVMEKNRFDSGLMVPVWNFWGTTVSTWTNVKTRATRESVEQNELSLLSINAIDGSIIDPWKGY